MFDIGLVCESLLSLILDEAVSTLKSYIQEQKKLERLQIELKNSLEIILNSEKDNPFYNDLTQVLSNSKIIADYVNRCVCGEKGLDIDSRLDSLVSKRKYKHDQIQYIRSTVHRITVCIEKVLSLTMDLSENIQTHRILNRFDELEESIKKHQNERQGKKHAVSERSQVEISTLNGQSRPDFDDVSIIRRKIIPVEKQNSINHTSDTMALAAVLEYKRIILSDDAGSGKTYSIYQLYAEAEAKGFHVVFFSPPDSSAIATLDRLANENYILNMHTILLLDGYDELSEANKSQLISSIISVVKLYPDINIVLSTRGNAIDANITNLEFLTCSLEPLEDVDIYNYLNQNNIDSVLFLQQVREQDLLELYRIPFYLKELVYMWGKNCCLPSKSTLMRKMVQTRLDADSIRHSKTQVKLQQTIQAKINLIERIALIMQCMQRQYLTSSEIDEIVDCKNNVLEHYGFLICSSEGTWQFSHNIFREYFSALALVNCSFEEIRAFITTPGNKSTIRLSWYNVMAFLLSECLIQDCEKFYKILDWLVENDPNVLLFCEKDKVKEDVRTAVFVHIFDESKRSNTWVNHGIFYDRHMASFTCTPKTIEYILAELSSPIQDKQKQNLLRALACFDQFCNFDVKVVETVQRILFEEGSSLYLQCDAVNVMVKHSQTFKNMDYAMLELFRYKKDVELRYKIICFWQQREIYEDFFDVILDEFDIHERVSDEFFSYRHLLSTLVESITRVSSVELLLRYLIADRGKIFELRNTKAVSNCCLVGIASYTNDPKDPILALLLQLVAYPFGLDSNDFEAIKQYMVSTNTENEFVDAILSKNTNSQSAVILGKLVCDSVLNALTTHYLAGALEPIILEDIAQNIDVDLSLRRKIAQILFVNTGSRISINPHSSWEDKTASAAQIYLEALFERDKYDLLLDRIISILGENASLGMKIELESYEKFSRMNSEYELHWCWVDLNSWFRDAEDIRIQHCLDKIKNWDFFRMCCVTRLFENNPREIELSNSQRDMMERYVLSAFQTIDFDRIEVDGQSIKYPSILPRLLRAMHSIRIKCPQELATKLLSVPLCLFDDRDHYDTFPEWVLQPLDSSVIAKVIVQKIIDKELNALNAQTYIRYCIDNKITECKNLIVDFIQDSEYNCGHYFYGIEYIAKLFGETTLIEEIITQCSDEKVLLCVANYISDNTVSEEFDTKLWEIYSANKDLECLRRLIARGNCMAIEEYYNLAKESMTLPDNVAEPLIPPVADSLTQIASPQYTEVMIKLYQLAYEKDFKDRKEFGLRYYSSSALQRIAYKNAEMVISKLEQSRTQNDEWNTEINNLIQIIKADKIRSSDTPWSFEEALTLVPKQ